MAGPSLSLAAPSPTANLHDYKEFDNHEFVIALSDKASGLKAYVAIHNRNLGLAHGGTRMKQYDDESDAVRDVLNLSRAMSYKSALAGLPYGGGKGVIIIVPGASREAVLQAYAEKLDALNGLFHTGTDVGLTDDDVRFMAEHSRYMLGVAEGDKGGFSTSKTAALGVYYAIQTAAQHKYGSDNLSGLTVGIKGVGKLGGELARLLHADGVKLLLADTDTARLEKLQADCPGAQAIAADKIHAQPMNIYAPCALGAEFTPENTASLACDIISGGANNQLSDPSVGDLLHRRGILYAPDYVANAGGLIFVSEELESDGFHLERVKDRLHNIRTTLEMIFQRAEAEDLPTYRVADRLAEERIDGAAR